MTRCEDCLHFELCDALERCNGVPKISSYDCGCYENTTSIHKAKQEVAREIFEEIDRIVSEYCDRFIPPTEMVAMLFDLKKKYAESEDKK